MITSRVNCFVFTRVIHPVRPPYSFRSTRHSCICTGSDQPFAKVSRSLFNWSACVIGSPCAAHLQLTAWNQWGCFTRCRFDGCRLVVIAMEKERRHGYSRQLRAKVCFREHAVQVEYGLQRASVKHHSHPPVHDFLRDGVFWGRQRMSARTRLGDLNDPCSTLGAHLPGPLDRRPRADTPCKLRGMEERLWLL